MRFLTMHIIEMYEEIVTGFSAPISIWATLAPLLGDSVKKVA